ncbi:MAG TPA: DUF3106 domain-containing protein [Nitrospiria bacterium]
MMKVISLTTAILAGMILSLGGVSASAAGTDSGSIEASYLAQNGRLTADQKKSFEELPPEEQERIRKNYKKFKDMPAPKQEQLKKRYEKWQELPPEQRKKLRKDMEQQGGKPGRGK